MISILSKGVQIMRHQRYKMARHAESRRCGGTAVVAGCRKHRLRVARPIAIQRLTLLCEVPATGLGVLFITCLLRVSPTAVLGRKGPGAAD